jgi:hypothetical protein
MHVPPPDELEETLLILGKANLKLRQLRQENELLRAERDHYHQIYHEAVSSCGHCGELEKAFAEIEHLRDLINGDNGTCLVYRLDPETRKWSVDDRLTHGGRP